MKKFVTFGAALLGLLVVANVALAQAAGAAGAGGAGGALGMDLSSKFFGAGLTTIGAAYGIGRLAGSALESMARQPEVADQIRTAMIIAAALIEGFTFFALFICFQG